MYFKETLALFMGAFVVWGFLMAMFFNLMLFGFKAKTDIRLVWTSIVVTISYLTSDLLYEMLSGAEVYLTWFYYDLVTLAFILPVLFVGKSPKLSIISPGVVYVLIGLTFNACLFFLIHWDLEVAKTTDKWWFWSFYSIGVNLSDLTMIVALIVDRDILGFITLFRNVREKIAKVIQRAEVKHFTALKA